MRYGSFSATSFENPKHNGQHGTILGASGTTLRLPGPETKHVLTQHRTRRTLQVDTLTIFLMCFGSRTATVQDVRVCVVSFIVVSLKHSLIIFACPMSHAQSHLLDLLPHARTDTPASVLLTSHRDDHRENDPRQKGEFGRLAEQSPFTEWMSLKKKANSKGQESLRDLRA